MSEQRYVRITPPTKRAKCKRYTMGGRMFEVGQWYQMDATKAELLRHVEQAPGIKVFQIYDEPGFRQVANAELMAAARAAGFNGMALLPDMQMPTPKVEKEGPQKSRYEGLESVTKEVEVQRFGAPPVAPVAPVPEAPPTMTQEPQVSAAVPEAPPLDTTTDPVPEGPELDLDEMTKTDLYQFAQAQGISGVLVNMKKDTMVQTIEEALAAKGSAE